MSTAFILMCGRLGGFAGSNLVGVLLAGMCTSIFYVNGALLLSELKISKNSLKLLPNSYDNTIWHIVFACFTGCVFLFLTMNTGDKKPNKPINQPKWWDNIIKKKIMYTHTHT